MKDSINESNTFMLKFLLYKSLVLSLLIALLAGCYPFSQQYQFNHNVAPKPRNKAYINKRKDYGDRTALAAGLGTQYTRMAHFPQTDKQYLIQQLYCYNIQFIQYRDTITLIIPTDQYFLFNSERLNDLCFQGLNYVVDLIQLYPGTTVYIAGFSDQVGERHMQNELTQARAEAMLTYFWAHGISSKYLKANGLGARFPIGDQATVRGAAMNRHIEVQWTTSPDETLGHAMMSMK
jgi:outer membrane protein OmpA-like peptidoglycan-associated protein